MNLSNLTIGEIALAIGLIATIGKLFDFYYKTRKHFDTLEVRVSELETKLQDEKVLKIAMQAVLKDRIIQQYKIFKENNKLSLIDKDNLSSLFKNYTALDGNSGVDALYKEMMDAPVEILK